MSARKKVSSRPKKGHQFRWLSMLMGLSGVAVLSAAAGALLAVSLASTPLLHRELTPEEAAVFGEGDRITSGMNLRLPALIRPVNILVVGTKVLTSDLDQPPSTSEELGYHALVNSFEGHTDTMLLLRFDPDSDRVILLSIPRDTQIALENYDFTKINAANVYGGPALTALAVQDLLGGVQIDRYVRVNVQGIEKLVDALGGVEIYVPKDMKYQDDSQHLYINLKAGKQHLNGDEALQFLRFRYDAYGDIGRIQRQQTLIRALMDQAMTPAILPRLPKIVSVIKSHIDTNLTIEELMALSGFTIKAGLENTEMLMLPGRFSTPEEYVTSYWIPDEENIQDMMAQHFDAGYGFESYRTVQPEEIHVAIQDSTGNEDAAWLMVDQLQATGYTNIFVDYPWYEPLRKTRIIAQQGNVRTAKALQQMLGLGEVRVDSTGNLNSDITIQIGQDWLRQGATTDQDFMEHSL